MLGMPKIIKIGQIQSTMALLVGAKIENILLQKRGQKYQHD
jgi:hypothetical protein